MYYTGKSIRTDIRQISDVFYRFKIGTANLAYPLALGIYNALRSKRKLDYDCIVPIPLSPDKVAAGELNRTLLLARELSRLLGVRVADLLSLTRSISKHRLRTGQGFSAPEFERAYGRALSVSERASQFENILLIDDVCTEGSTLRVAADALKAAHAGAKITSCAAGQMIVKAVVVNDCEIARDRASAQGA